MKLRRATINDIETLEKWDREPHVINAAGDDDGFYVWKTELPREVTWREFLIAEDHGRPIGFIQIIDPKEEESHYWGACDENLRAIDIWIGDKNDLSRGYGTQMMRLAIERCFAPPEVTAILIDPLRRNKDARRFYERIGFEFVEIRFFDEDECAVYQLTRERWANPPII